jgi:hypothetical protein
MPKADDPQSQVVVIQAICTHWEKSARGGLNAVLRNRVPEAVKVAEAKIPLSPLIHVAQYVYNSGLNKYTKPVRTIIAPPTTTPRQAKGIFFDFAGDMLSVAYQYDRGQGAPERFAGKVKAFDLSQGEWGRIRYNGRYSDVDNGHWWYEKWVWNIGLFSSVSPTAFLKTEPVKVASYMGLLK